MAVLKGGCLCGALRYTAEGKPSFPHLCSCIMCQKWSGAPTVAWFEMPADGISWDGPGGEPRYFQSSEKSRRGFCPVCGGTVCAVDEGYDKISLTIASLDEPSAIVPGKQHSFQKAAPDWWSVKIERPGSRRR